LSEKQRIKVFPIVMAVIVIGMVLLLAMTNPKKPDYVSWTKDQTIAKSSDFLEKTITALLVPTMVENNTEISNFVLFTTFTTNVGAQEIKVIGIFNNFIVISFKKI